MKTTRKSVLFPSKKLNVKSQSFKIGQLYTIPNLKRMDNTEEYTHWKRK